MSQFRLNKVKPLTSGKRRVYCETHGSVSGFIACTHIMKFHAEVRHYAPPPADRERLGEISCIKPVKEHELHEWLLVCVHCARAAGIDRVSGRITPHGD